ncbi:TetR/AcrR family transcriptional regulator [Naasia lichenicola]|uniref:TetR/AcrR family transcriptional regulator n=1 Tax=Naasia lichenicola TaxID=2565933 RepID=A0A4S4FMM3_9MICO|nr:TetR family transcriptional regulator [Naasia lichenicola]THG31498.1 TetR/AcrR family transcriptional regulator [Naasia lichenicola]
MTEEDVEIPRGIALAWGIPAASDRKQKTELSVDRIISVALELADESGLAAVSMAAVAGRLGYTPMSLYRYVAAKDDLVMLMGDAAVGSPPEDVAAATDWRSAVDAWIEAILDLYERHPWLLDLPANPLPVTPNAVDWMESLLGSFATTNLTIEDTVRAAILVTGQARWEATMLRLRSNVLPEGAALVPVSTPNARVLSSLLDDQSHPSMSRMLRSRFSGDGQRASFGVERALDGLALYIDAQPPLPAD